MPDAPMTGPPETFRALRVAEALCRRAAKNHPLGTKGFTADAALLDQLREALAAYRDDEPWADCASPIDIETPCGACGPCRLARLLGSERQEGEKP